MSKPTPGPWEAVGRHTLWTVRQAGHQTPLAVIQIDFDNEPKTTPENPRYQEIVSWHDQNCEANARFIAAAPDLEDACRLMLKEHERLQRQNGWADSPGVRAARAALARIEGKGE